jgi:molybdopterin converting factor small subunit
MKINILAFGIAKDILGDSSLSLTLEDGASIASLREELLRKFVDFEKLKSLKFAVNESYKNDDYVLHQGDEVVIIPPVSGG